METHKMKKNILGLLVAAVLASATGVLANGEHIDWKVISSGGECDMNTPTLHTGAIVGQIAIGTSTSGSVTCITGFLQDFDLEGGGGGCCVGRVGDANSSGEDEPTIGDISTMIDAKFVTGACDGLLTCLPEADVNLSGGAAASCDDITVGDITVLIDYLFITGQSVGLPNCP
jgi:hypothetical protein